MLVVIKILLKFFLDLAWPLLSVAAVAITQTIDYGGFEAIQFAGYTAGLMLVLQVFRNLFVANNPPPKNRRRPATISNPKPAPRRRRRARAPLKKDAK